MKYKDFDSIETEFPWQETPTKLIMYAIEMAEKGGEFQSHIAYLLLDVGVETLLKTFLSIDSSISEATTKHEERNKIVKSESFYKITEGVKTAVGDRLDPEFVGQVMYFHNIRNKMYHQGDGVTITQKNLAEYTIFAEELLEELLGVSLKPKPVPIDELSQIGLSSYVEDDVLRASYVNNIDSELEKLEIYLVAAIGYIKPSWGTPYFIDTFELIWKEYGDDDSDTNYRRRTENQELRKELFTVLTQSQETDFNVIDLYLQDRTLLYLKEVLEHIPIITPLNELGMYNMAKHFAEGDKIMRSSIGFSISHKQQPFNEFEEIYIDLDNWIRNIKENIQTLFDRNEI